MESPPPWEQSCWQQQELLPGLQSQPILVPHCFLLFPPLASFVQNHHTGSMSRATCILDVQLTFLVYCRNVWLVGCQSWFITVRKTHVSRPVWVLVNCVFVFLRLCVFACLCLCVIVSLCNCVFACLCVCVIVVFLCLCNCCLSVFLSFGVCILVVNLDLSVRKCQGQSGWWSVVHLNLSVCRTALQ